VRPVFFPSRYRREVGGRRRGRVRFRADLDQPLARISIRGRDALSFVSTRPAFSGEGRGGGEGRGRDDGRSSDDLPMLRVSYRFGDIGFEIESRIEREE